MVPAGWGASAGRRCTGSSTSIAPLGVLHYSWMKAAKNNIGKPLLFAIIVALLLAVRLYWNRAKVLAARA